MRKVMKTRVIVMTALLCTALLAGCGSSDKKETGKTSDKSEKTTTASKTAGDNADTDKKADDKETKEASAESKESDEKTDNKDQESEPETFTITEENVIGAWEYNIGSEYTGFILEPENEARYLFTDGTTIDGRWAIEDGILKVRAVGGMESFYLGKDKLIATDGSREYLKVEKLAAIEKTDKTDVDAKDQEVTAETYQITDDNVIGAWEYNIGSEYTGFILEPENEARYLFTDGTTIDGRWAIEDGILKVRAVGGMESFYLGKDKLIATDGSREYLKVEKLASIEKIQ